MGMFDKIARHAAKLDGQSLFAGLLRGLTEEHSFFVDWDDGRRLVPSE